MRTYEYYVIFSDGKGFNKQIGVSAMSYIDAVIIASSIQIKAGMIITVSKVLVKNERGILEVVKEYDTPKSLIMPD